MVKQYREYSLPRKLQINGDLTLKENIADNGAIKEAYQAYEKYVSKFGEELLLPGLRYTSRQLFWIAAAMVNDNILNISFKLIQFYFNRIGVVNLHRKCSKHV